MFKQPILVFNLVHIATTVLVHQFLIYQKTYYRDITKVSQISTTHKRPTAAESKHLREAAI